MRRLGLDPTKAIYLKPGDFWFGCAPAHLYTILGSCISITLWHPQRKVGGMCHYLLPKMELSLAPQQMGRTAGEAMALFLQAIRRYGTRPGEYQVKVFGGASLLIESPGAQLAHQVSTQNVAPARQLLRESGFQIVSESVGGRASRKLVFDLTTGDAWQILNAARP